jgi:hypothetical protein
MGDDRPSVYLEGTNVIYRASSLGNCDKELVAIRCGFTPAPFPVQFRKIFADGHRAEDVILDALAARGHTITRHQEEINLEVLPGVFIRGHIDGADEANGAVVDAKSTSDRGIAPALMAKYEWQMSVYCHALGFDKAYFAVGVKDRATGDVDPASVSIHHMDTLIPLGQIKGRVAKLESFARHYMETGDYPACEETQYPCGAFALHNKGDVDPYGGFPISPVLEDNSLDAYCQMYAEAQQAEAEAKDAKANARKFILEHIGGEGEQRRTDRFEIKWSGTGIKKELDKRALEKFLAAYGKTIDEFMGTKSVSQTISVKEIA